MMSSLRLSLREGRPSNELRSSSRRTATNCQSISIRSGFSLPFFTQVRIMIEFCVPDSVLAMAIGYRIPSGHVLRQLLQQDPIIALESLTQSSYRYQSRRYCHKYSTRSTPYICMYLSGFPSIRQRGPETPCIVISNKASPYVVRAAKPTTLRQTSA